MPLLTLEQALGRVDQLSDAALISPFRVAVSEWNEIEKSQPKFAATCSSTTRAGIIHDLAVREARSALTGSSGGLTREITSLPFFAIGFGDDLVVRYKYIGSGKPQNVSTKIQQQLAKHQFEEDLMTALTLEGVSGPPTLVTCGYTLGFDGALQAVNIQCDHNGQTIWSKVIWDDNAEWMGSLELFPITPDLAPEATIVRSAKKADEKDSGREAQ